MSKMSNWTAVTQSKFAHEQDALDFSAAGSSRLTPVLGFSP